MYRNRSHKMNGEFEKCSECDCIFSTYGDFIRCDICDKAFCSKSKCQNNCKLLEKICRGNCGNLLSYDQYKDTRKYNTSCKCGDGIMQLRKVLTTDDAVVCRDCFTVKHPGNSVFDFEVIRYLLKGRSEMLIRENIFYRTGINDAETKYILLSNNRHCAFDKLSGDLKRLLIQFIFNS